MDDFQFLRVKPLSKKTTRAASTSVVILNVMKHNLREIQAEFGTRGDSTIDPRRICDNVILYGASVAADVGEEARAAMREADITVRKNATVGIEIILSLSADTTIDCDTYFEEAAYWLRAYFGVPILSAVIHYDESYPHAHVVLLPIRDGKLAASEVLGGRAEAKTLHKQFNEQVGKHYGLRLPPPQKRHNAAVCQSALDAAFVVLEANSGLDAGLLRALLAPHLKNPEPLLAALGLPMPAPKLKGSFVATMTRPCTNKKTPNRTFSNPLLGHLGPKTKSPMLC